MKSHDGTYTEPDLAVARWWVMEGENIPNDVQGFKPFLPGRYLPVTLPTFPERRKRQRRAGTATVKATGERVEFTWIQGVPLAFYYGGNCGFFSASDLIDIKWDGPEFWEE